MGGEESLLKHTSFKNAIMISNTLQANLTFFKYEKTWFIDSFMLIKPEGEVESHICFLPSPRSFKGPRSKKQGFSNVFLFLLKTNFQITLFIYVFYMCGRDRQTDRNEGRTCATACGGQKTTHKNLFSHSTMWIPAIAFLSQAWQHWQSLIHLIGSVNVSSKTGGNKDLQSICFVSRVKDVPFSGVQHLFLLLIPFPVLLPSLLHAMFLNNLC